VGTPISLEALCELERHLHRPEVRSNPRALDELLHPAFREFGRSGAIYSRSNVLSEFSASPQTYEIWSQDFMMEELLPGLALLTYRSAHIAPSGGLDRHTLRASLWQRTAAGWRIRFHQGTPTEAFAKHST